ncbi:zinc ribbon domain-containing protein [Paenibacillus sp. sgz500958]|uniref:zinc ribbon domain-containing protein n=1 Tax=Paenibacillus sp. sgz500958 TaxID=3242475 RepID=UPI0036D25046
MEEHQAVAQEAVFCQSCGMPMHDSGVHGSDREGNKTAEYCMYCYESGEFKQPELTLQDMIDLCTGFMVQEGMPEEEARQLLAVQLPTLERWRALRSLEVN